LFSNWRWGHGLDLTQIIFYGLPWLDWGQRQAVLFDLGARRFYIFNLVLYPQDFIYLTGMLVISALSLFLFTAVAGRLWCGYACPQTVYTEIFLWIEKKIEGDRSARMRRDAAPGVADKFSCARAANTWRGLRRVVDRIHLCRLFHADSGTGRELFTVAWVLGNVLDHLLRFRHLRQCRLHARAGLQAHVPVCTLPERHVRQGHPDRVLRRSPGRAPGSPLEKGRSQGARSGACVDCTLCVQVCPTGIDIRKGCNMNASVARLCIDVCDTVMDKVGYPRGLIRYSTQHAMSNGWSRAEVIRHMFRPRVLVYLSILLAIVVTMAVSLSLRIPFKVDIVRDRGSLARTVGGGKTENVYRLQLMNASESLQRYKITASGLPGLTVASESSFSVEPTQARWVVVNLQLPYGGASSGSHVIHFEIESLDSPGKLTEKSVFIVPR
jgi:polyferredoxin